MDRKLLSKIFVVLAYCFLIGACVGAFAYKGTVIPLWALLIALLFKMLQERSKRIAIEQENEKLKDDLRRLTHLLEYLKNGGEPEEEK